MAEYVSISANKTYTFKKELTITMPEGTESQIGNFAALCIKAFRDDVETAIILSPSVPSSAINFKFYASGGSNLASTGAAYSTLLTYVGLNGDKSSCTVDGVTYWGYKAAKYQYLQFRGTNTNGNTVSVGAITIPQFTLTCVMYVSASGTIETRTYTTEERTISAQRYSLTSNSVAWAYNDIYIEIPKEANDIVLSLSVEYAE